MNKIYYAGIGSRSVPHYIGKLMTKMASRLEANNCILRSGGADGSDTYFERGVKDKAMKEIFLPWARFNGNYSGLTMIPDVAYQIAAEFHPNWNRLSDPVRKLMARNSQQVLGANCDSPSKFILCYTKNATGSGGTGQALRIAKAFNVPIFDLGAMDTMTSEEDKHIYVRTIGEQIKELI